MTSGPSSYMTPDIRRVLERYGAKDPDRCWASIKVAVRAGVPLTEALGQLRKNQPGLFVLEVGKQGKT